MHALRQELGDALVATGLGEYLESSFTPHLTVAYAKDALTEPIQIKPIVWKVCEFALMDSHVGQSTHAEIERWPLRA